MMIKCKPATKQQQRRHQQQRSISNATRTNKDRNNWSNWDIACCHFSRSNNLFVPSITQQETMIKCKPASKQQQQKQQRDIRNSGTKLQAAKGDRNNFSN
jgi:hypothetical protein